MNSYRLTVTNGLFFTMSINYFGSLEAVSFTTIPNLGAKAVSAVRRNSLLTNSFVKMPQHN